jgi:hypothetical protein
LRNVDLGIVELTVSAAQLNYYSCLCEETKYVSDKQSGCEVCPSGTLCTPSFVATDDAESSLDVTTIVTIKPGWYPVYTVSGQPAFRDVFNGKASAPDVYLDQITVVRCYRPLLCAYPTDQPKAHQVGGTSPKLVRYFFQCADRADPNSFMCSRCDNESVDFLGICYECTVALQVISAFLSFVALFGVFIFFWSRNWRSMAGSISIALFFMQLSPALSRHHSSKRKGGTFFQLIHWITNATYINPSGLQCSFGEGLRASYPDFWVSVASLPAAIFLCWIGYRIRTWRLGHKVSAKRLLNYFVGRLHFFMYLLYFPVSHHTLSVFNCQSIPGVENGDQYVDAAPWMSCSCEQYSAMYAVAIIVTLVYIVGFPLYFGIALYRSRYKLTLQDDESIERFGFMFVMYSPLFMDREKLAALHDELTASAQGATSDHHDDAAAPGIIRGPHRQYAHVPLLQRWEWEFFVNGGRKLLLALVLGLMRFDSDLIPVVILLILMISSVAQARVRPYLNHRDNVLDTLFVSIAAVVYMAELVVLHSDDEISRDNSLVGVFTQLLWASGEILALFVVFALGMRRAIQPAVQFVQARKNRQADWDEMLGDINADKLNSMEDLGDFDDEDIQAGSDFDSVGHEDHPWNDVPGSLELTSWNVHVTAPSSGIDSDAAEPLLSDTGCESSLPSSASHLDNPGYRNSATSDSTGAASWEVWSRESRGISFGRKA